MSSTYSYQSLASLICLKQIKKQASQQLPGGEKNMPRGWEEKGGLAHITIGCRTGMRWIPFWAWGQHLPPLWPHPLQASFLPRGPCSPFTELALPWKGTYELSWLLGICCLSFLIVIVIVTFLVAPVIQELWALELFIAPQIWQEFLSLGGFPGSSGSKESSCNAGNPGSIPGMGRSPGGGHGNPLRILALRTPTDRGAWRATAHGVTKESDTTERLSTAHLFGSLHVPLLRLGILSLP